MSSTELILSANIPKLGAEAGIVKVRSGFARNFLFSQGKALEIAAGSLCQINHLRAKRAERQAREATAAEELASKINMLSPRSSRHYAEKTLSHRLFRMAFWLMTAFFTVQAMAGLQLSNLNETPTKDRFPITGRVWPTSPGAAVICLWEDDKLCAFTMSVDDNTAPQVPNWLEKAAEVGFPVTWFLITDRIGTVNVSFNGDWPLWADVLAKGHDVQSHSRRHLHVEDADWPGIEEEYAGSRRAIEANLPGHKCDFLAFPGGENSHRNDRTVAVQHYAGNRGGVGSGFNRPTRIDYMAIKNGSFILGGTTPSVNLLSLFNAADVRYYRGWAAPLFHQVNDWPGTEFYFTFVRTYRADVWAARFSDVGKYGQQRDTHKLQVTENTLAQIVFSLTDDMDDKVFDYPLTIKLRLPDNWNSVVATQNGQPVGARFVRHAGSPYALVRGVPDKGNVTVTQAVSPTYGGQTYRQWRREHVLPADKTGLGAGEAAPAKDDIRNVMKYALGLDPRVAGYAGRFSTEVDSSNRLTMVFSRPYPIPSDVEYLPEASSDLVGWTGEGLAIEEVSIVDGIQTMRVVGPVPADSENPKRFIRLRVQEKPPSPL